MFILKKTFILKIFFQFSLIGRVKCPLPLGERVYISMPDESTLTYDLYQSLGNQNSDDDITIAICPGKSIKLKCFIINLIT